MALVIKTTSPARARASKYLPPVMQGLEYLFLGDADSPGKNWAVDRPDGEVYGTPVRGPDGISWRFKGLANFVEAGSWEVDSETHFIVCRTFAQLDEQKTSPQFFGTAFGVPVKEDTTNNTYGSRLYISTAGAVRYAAGRGTSVDDHVQGDAAVSVDDHKKYQLFVCRTDPVNTILDASTGASSINSSSAPRFPARRRYRLGSGYATQEGECDVLAWAKFSAALSDDQVTAMVADMRRYCATLGVTV